MKFPFWSNLLKQLSSPLATDKDFDTAADLANNPNFCLIGEGVGFGYIGQNGEKSGRLTPTARQIYYGFTGSLFRKSEDGTRNPKGLERAQFLLRRAQRQRKLLK